MDAKRFDRLVESLTRSGTRRGVLRTLTGAILGLAGIDRFTQVEAAAKGKGKRRTKDRNGGKRKRRVRAAAIPARCCNTGNCAPGPGKNLGKCCFEDANFAGQNFQGANLGGANLTGAILTDADFRGANLGKACLIDANLTGAVIDGSTNLFQAVFCRTTMPDGSVNHSGCTKGNRCCETCNRAVGESCAAAGDVCCPGATCCGGTCVDITSDENHCGGCGNACDPGLTCCSGQCVNLLTDLDNCTACGNACPEEGPEGVQNAMVACGPGFDDEGRPGHGCTFLCNAGFADCDDDPFNGCERSISNDPNNCGNCGNTCDSPDLPRCCGCRCQPPPPSTTCSTCQPVGNARLIRRR